MKHNVNIYYQKAFTLVELAIVLVIVGLVVSGVLAGRDLIEQYRFSALRTQFTEVETAMTAFQNKFHQSPGDFSIAETIWPNDSLFTGFNTDNGDNDGDLRVFSINSGEHRMFFQHLQLAGMYAGVQEDFTSSNETGVGIPASPFSEVGLLPANYNRCATIHTKDESLRAGVWNSSDNNVYTEWEDSVTLYRFDLKYDDGLPYGGRIMTQSNCYSSGVYEDDPDTEDCGINYCLPTFGINL